MDHENDEYFIKYCNNNSILVINKTGKLKRIYTPFKVFKWDIKSGIRKVFIVDKVNSTKEDKLMYVINGAHYHHTDFTIEINF